MKPKKLFIVRKFIMAADLAEAIRIEKTRKPDDVWMDDEWRKANMAEPAVDIGFKKRNG